MNNEKDTTCPEYETLMEQQLREQLLEEEAMEAELLAKADNEPDDWWFWDLCRGSIHPNELIEPMNAWELLDGPVYLRPYRRRHPVEQRRETRFPYPCDSELGEFKPGTYRFRNAYTSADADADEPFFDYEFEMDIQEGDIRLTDDVLYIISCHLKQLTSSPEQVYINQLYYSEEEKVFACEFMTREEVRRASQPARQQSDSAKHMPF